MLKRMDDDNVVPEGPPKLIERRKREMKISSKLAILLSALLLFGVAASVPVTFCEPSSNLENFGKPNADLVSGSETLDSLESITPKGAAGSGWKPDVIVAGTLKHEQEPSIATYINPKTGTVTLYAVARHYYDDFVPPRWGIRLYKSTDQGASWSLIAERWWAIPPRDLLSPSIAVSPYNGTVFIAVQVGEWLEPLFSNDIYVYRFPGPEDPYGIDWSIEDHRYPKIISQYGYGDGNDLYVTYEAWFGKDDRDLMFAYSWWDWGKTWTTIRLRGALLTPEQEDVFSEMDITCAYVGRYVYIAYRHSTDADTKGHIDVSYSRDPGNLAAWVHKEDVSNVEYLDFHSPSIATARVLLPGAPPQPVMVAYNKDGGRLFYAWSLDGGDTWSGGDDKYHRIESVWLTAVSPKVTVDGMGTELTDVRGNFHLVYATPGGLCYAQLPWWDLPQFREGPDGQLYWGQLLGWPYAALHGIITDEDASVWGAPAITAYMRKVGTEWLWEPAVAWTDNRNLNYDIYYSTTGTDFNITYSPSSQTVVAGKSVSYKVTVSILSGPATYVALEGTAHWPKFQSTYVQWDYSTTQLLPPDYNTSTLKLYTSNLMPPGDYQFTAAAIIGGYRRIILIPYTVTAPPTLTLDIVPSTVARGSSLTIYINLTPAPGAPATIYLFYRFPHQTGIWRLATTLTTGASGYLGVTVTVPTGITIGQYDLVAFWVNLTNGSYATSTIEVLTIK